MISCTKHKYPHSSSRISCSKTDSVFCSLHPLKSPEITGRIRQTRLYICGGQFFIHKLNLHGRLNVSGRWEENTGCEDVYPLCLGYRSGGWHCRPRLPKVAPPRSKVHKTVTTVVPSFAAASCAFAVDLRICFFDKQEYVHWNLLFFFSSRLH